ncbi:MAG: hypothetical protein Q9218_008175 [Villophora microphyllina]
MTDHNASSGFAYIKIGCACGRWWTSYGGTISDYQCPCEESLHSRATISGPKCGIMISSTKVDITGASVNITGKEIIIHGFEINVSGPGVVISGDKIDITTCRFNISGSGIEISGLEVCIVAKALNISGYRVEITGNSLEILSTKRKITGARVKIDYEFASFSSSKNPSSDETSPSDRENSNSSEEETTWRKPTNNKKPHDGSRPNHKKPRRKTRPQKPPKSSSIPKPSAPDFYNVFDISPLSTHAEIEKAAKKKRIEVHPDKLKKDGMTAQELRMIDERTKLVGGAADTLLDEALRRVYDERRRGGRL